MKTRSFRLKILGSVLYMACLSPFQMNGQCVGCKNGIHIPMPGDSVSNTKRATNGSGSLGQSYLKQNICGLNYVTASQLVETRSSTFGFNTNGTGIPTSLTIAGLPTGCDSIIKAYLYWDASYTSGPANPAVVKITNPAAANFSYNVAQIGVTGSKCWGEIGTVAYRGDITTSISGNGVYKVNITGAGNSGTEIDGVSLIVIYKDMSATYTGSIVLYDGAMVITTSGANIVYNASGFKVCSASTGSAFAIQGDMQANINGDTNVEIYNGTSKTFTNDFWNFNIIPTTYTSGQTTSVFNTDVNNLTSVAGDCYSTILCGLYWQNTTCLTCNPPINLKITPASDSICLGQSATLTASGGTSYTWSTGATTSSINISPAVNTTYWVKGPVGGCSIDSTSATIYINPTPVVTLSKGDSVCPGGAAQINVVSSIGSGTFTYNWNNGVGAGAGPHTVNPVTSTYYVCTMTDACGDNTRDSVLVYTYPLPIVNFTADSLQGCYPLCTNFTDNSTSAAGTITAWRWDFGNGANDTIQNPRNCYTKPGKYNVSLTVTSSKGCKSSLTINNMIDAYPHPHADFSFSPQPVSTYDPSVSFTDLSTGGVNTWLWTFGDTSNAFSLLQNPGHTYPADSGIYCAVLRVADTNKCTDSVEHCVVVEPYFTLYIPNAFSPNHDGRNDVFQPRGAGVQTFEMYIFDRWGQQLFHTADITIGWNGIVNKGTKVAEEDTYVYLIYATDLIGNSYQYIGSVSLVK